MFAAVARLAPAAYVALASLRPSAWQVGLAPAVAEDTAVAAGDESPAVVGPVLQDEPGAAEQRRMELLELMGIHRQMRGAATNLNQAVAKLHSLGEPVGELAAMGCASRERPGHSDRSRGRPWILAASSGSIGSVVRPSGHDSEHLVGQRGEGVRSDGAEDRNRRDPVDDR